MGKKMNDYEKLQKKFGQSNVYKKDLKGFVGGGVVKNSKKQYDAEDEWGLKMWLLEKKQRDHPSFHERGKAHIKGANKRSRGRILYEKKRKPWGAE